MTDSEVISVVLPTRLLGDVRARAAARRPGSPTASVATAVVCHFGCGAEPLEDDALAAEAQRAAQRERAAQNVVVSPGLARGAAGMTQKERITIEIPADVAARLREAVAEGAFASESEAVQEALETILFADADGPVIDDAWLRREVLPVLDRIDRGEEDAVPIEEAFRGIEERYLARKAGGRRGE